MQRNELELFLEKTFKYNDYEDYCTNGLQVEGKNEIEKIMFGVSFNLPFLEKAIKEKVDAIIVHHGIFGKSLFSLRGIFKDKIKLLLDNGISLFGIHLPLDAHPEIGNNAQLFSYFDGEILEPFNVGFVGNNPNKLSITKILEMISISLLNKNPFFSETVLKKDDSNTSVLFPKIINNFTCFLNGPKIPKKIGIVSGGSSYSYENAINKGVDTFICGDNKEQIPAISYETKTNFINIGHYYSEKAGIMALKKLIDQKFDVQTKLVFIDNIV